MAGLHRERVCHQGRGQWHRDLQNGAPAAAQPGAGDQRKTFTRAFCGDRVGEVVQAFDLGSVRCWRTMRNWTVPGARAQAEARLAYTMQRRCLPHSNKITSLAESCRGMRSSTSPAAASGTWASLHTGGPRLGGHVFGHGNQGTPAPDSHRHQRPSTLTSNQLNGPRDKLGKTPRQISSPGMSPPTSVHDGQFDPAGGRCAFLRRRQVLRRTATQLQHPAAAATPQTLTPNSQALVALNTAPRLLVASVQQNNSARPMADAVAARRPRPRLPRDWQAVAMVVTKHRMAREVLARRLCAQTLREMPTGPADQPTAPIWKGQGSVKMSRRKREVHRMRHRAPITSRSAIFNENR